MRSKYLSIGLYSLPLGIFTIWILKKISLFSDCQGGFSSIGDCMLQNHTSMVLIIFLSWTLIIYFFLEWLKKKQNGKGSMNILVKLIRRKLRS